MNSIISPNTAVATVEASRDRLGEVQSKIASQSKIKAYEMEKIEETAKEFEAVFVSEMLKPMFKEIKSDGMFGGGKGEEVFRGMMLQEYGKMLSETGSLGIADQVKAAMIQMQEEANSTEQTNQQEQIQTPLTNGETIQ